MKNLKNFLFFIISFLLVINCEQNYPPETPNEPVGPSKGVRNEILTFKSSTTDPEGNNISYQFDWDDKNISNWSSYITSEDTISMNHSYADIGIYEIRVRAKDDYRPLFHYLTVGAVSDWSPTHTVEISEIDTINNPPNTPSVPIGPDTGLTGYSYTFKAWTTDPDEDEISYRFDWGDGILEWSNYIHSGDSISLNHKYEDSGTYEVKVKAKDEKSAESDWSEIHTIVILVDTTNNPPIIPSAPAGPINGYVGHSYIFTASTTDPEDDNISYQFDWGDGNLSTWTNYIPSGEYVSLDHTYEETGTYFVKVRAKDEKGAESDWSPEHQITIEETSADYPNRVIDTIYSGSGPRGIGVIPNGDYIYVTHRYSNNVYVIQTSDNSIVDIIPVGNDPRGIAVLPNGEYVYVSNWDDNNVYVIRTSDNAIIKTIPVGTNPMGVAAHPNGQYIYVACAKVDYVSVIRVSDNTVVDSIPVGSGPRYIAPLPNGEYVYVTNMPGNSVSVFRTSDNTVIETFGVGNAPHGIASLPNSEYVYVACMNTDNVYVIRTVDNSIVDIINYGGYSPQGLNVLPNGEYVYVTNINSNTVTVIRTLDNIVVDQIPVGNSPREVAPLHDGSRVYVTNVGGDNISVVGY